MKIRVTIEIPHGEKVPGYASNEGAVRMILADALGQFRDSRREAQRYVDERYPVGDYHWLNREEKIAQVRARVAMAEQMFQATQVELVPEGDEVLFVRMIEGSPPHGIYKHGSGAEFSVLMVIGPSGWTPYQPDWLEKLAAIDALKDLD